RRTTLPPTPRDLPSRLLALAYLVEIELGNSVGRRRRRRSGRADAQDLHLELEILASERVEETNGHGLVRQGDDLHRHRRTVGRLGREQVSHRELGIAGKAVAWQFLGGQRRLLTKRLAGRNDAAFLAAGTETLESLF